MKNRYDLGQRTGYITIAVNILLTLFKFVAAILANSSAMVADAVHSASDILATSIVVLSLKIARRPEDSGHPYGHEKAESIGAKFVSLFLLVAGIGIGWGAIKNIITGPTAATPAPLALYAAITSILVKEAMYWYTLSVAKKINSTALKADAWHHRSDAMSSVATFIGIGAARMGFPLGDPIAAFIVSLMILKTAYEILKKSLDELMDSSASSTTLKSIRDSIESVPGVKGIDTLRTRTHGNMVYADVEILVDKDLHVSEGHEIAKTVENTVKAEVKGIKAVMVHIHPFG